MKILFVASFSGIGGAERSLMPLARQLEAQGHELTLFLARPPVDAAVFKEFPGVVDTPKGQGGANAKTPAQFFRLAGLVRRTDLVVATSELTVTYAAWLLAAVWRKPLVADVQVHLSGWIRDNCHPVHRFLSRLIYPRVRGIRCVSEGVAKELARGLRGARGTDRGHPRAVRPGANPARQRAVRGGARRTHFPTARDRWRRPAHQPEAVRHRHPHLRGFASPPWHRRQPVDPR